MNMVHLSLFIILALPQVTAATSEGKSCQVFAKASQDGVVGSYAHDLKALGGEKFGQWLIDSFAGTWAEPKLGYFHSNEDAPFSVIFGQASEHFPEEHLAYARTGLDIALRSFHSENGTSYGLHELTGVMVALDAFHWVEKVTDILIDWVDPKAKTSKLSFDQAEDAVIFRELLENLVRLYQSAVEHQSPHVAAFAPLQNWAHEILAQGATGIEQEALIPSYAPLYVLALSVSEKVGDQDQIWKLLESGGPHYHRASTGLFSSYYVLRSAGDGRLLPYDLDHLVHYVEAHRQ